MNNSASLLPSEFEVGIQLGYETVGATLAIPADAHGIILFAHGSGSSRFSRRNRAVAASLNQANFATLLLDLFTRSEEARDALTGELRFNIPFLAQRLADATEWVRKDPRTRALPIGYFGASTGAAAALVAAAEHPEGIRAVVSRGGRPDLAGGSLVHVRAPTLLIVGERDVEVLHLNRLAQQQLRSPSKIEIVPEATHLFEEPGALEKVAALAKNWFAVHLEAPALIDGSGVRA
jgi:pimeloyl-ACP methyl ester carboxylesterase